MIAVGIVKSFLALGGIFSSVAAASLGFSGKGEQEDSIDINSPSLTSVVEDSETGEKKQIDSVWKVSYDEYQKSYLSELDQKLRFILSADSVWGWGDILRVNKKPADLDSVKKLMDECRKIFVLPKDSLTEQQKKSHYEFVKFNCQWPKTSGRKFKENGLNYVEKSRDIHFNTFASQNPRFWNSVVSYNNLKNRGNKTDIEKYRFYCDKFPTFQTTEEGYTTEELDYMEFCWSQRLK